MASQLGFMRGAGVEHELEPLAGVDRANASSRGAVPTDWQPSQTGHCGWFSSFVT